MGNLTGVTYPTNPPAVLCLRRHEPDDQHVGRDRDDILHLHAGRAIGVRERAVGQRHGQLTLHRPAADGAGFAAAQRLRLGAELRLRHGQADEERHLARRDVHLHLQSGVGGTTCASSLIAKVALPNGAWITNTYDSNARMLGTALTTAAPATWIRACTRTTSATSASR